VGAYRIEADGLLTHVSETPAGDHPFYIALDPAGKFLYSVDYTAMQVFAFSIGGDGTLTQLGSPLPCGQHPGFAAVDPQGKLLYVGGQDGRVFVYSIQADGSLAAAVSPPLQPRYFLEPAAVVFDPTGPFAYIADRAGYDVVAASVASNGELSPIRGYVTGGAPIAMATNACAIGPAITGLRADPEFLWPPNHAMTPVSILYDVADQCGPASCSLTVKSNEPESENPHDPDWVILGSHELLLSAEKAAAGGGREYDIAVTCGDARNNTRSAVTQVVVPRDQGMPQMPRRLNNIPGR
jgi:hypothetical protein